MVAPRKLNNWPKSIHKLPRNNSPETCDLLITYCDSFFDWVSCSLDWFQLCYVVENGLEFQIPLPPSLEYLNYKQRPLCLVQGIKLMSSCMVGKHPTNWATFPTHPPPNYLLMIYNFVISVASLRISFSSYLPPPPSRSTHHASPIQYFVLCFGF